LTDLNMFGTDVPRARSSRSSLFVIALSPLFGLLWLRMGRKEPSSPAKFMLGLIFVGIGFLPLVPASGTPSPSASRSALVAGRRLLLPHRGGALPQPGRPLHGH
jgi:dipeptide/tripeptide permease